MVLVETELILTDSIVICLRFLLNLRNPCNNENSKKK